MRRIGPFFRNGIGQDSRKRKELGFLDKLMSATGQSFGARTIRLPDGTPARVYVIKNGPRPVYIVRAEQSIVLPSPIITPQGLYLESGLLDLGFWNDGQPAVWYIGNDITALGSNALLGEITNTDGIFSSSLSVLDFTPSQPSITKTSSKKLAQAMCPASLYTGKLRAYVQAVYGSQLVSYVLDNPESPTPRVVINGVTLDYTGSTGNVLFTASEGVYYLLTISPTQLIARPLEVVTGFETEATTIRSALAAATGDQKFVYEGILFSLLRPGAVSHTSDFEIPNSDGVDFTTPLYYSWKANKNGTEIRTVFVVTDSCSQATLGRTVKLDVSYSEEFGFSVTPSVTTSVRGLINQLTLLWVPEPSINGSYLSIYNCPAAPGCEEIITGASSTFTGLPVYGFFDKDDVWKELTLSRSYSSVGPATSVPHLAVCGFDSDELEYELSFSSKYVDEFSLSFGESAVSAKDEDGPYSTKYWKKLIVTEGSEDCFVVGWEYLYPEGAGSCCPAWNLPYGGFTEMKVNAFTGVRDCYKYQISYNREVGSIAAVVPYYDSEAILLVGEQKTGDHDHVISTFATENQAMNNYGGDFKYPLITRIVRVGSPYTCTSTEYPNLYLVEADLYHCHTSEDAATGPVTSVSPGSVKQVLACLKDETKTISTKTTMSLIEGIPSGFIDEICANGALGAAQCAARDGNTVSPAAYYDSWDTFLTAPVGVCLGNLYVTERSKVLQSAVFHNALLPTGSSLLALNAGTTGYPDNIGDSFVGFA